MNIKTFLFWTAVGVVAITVSYFLIQWLKGSVENLAQKPRKEIGFHAIEANAVAAS